MFIYVIVNSETMKIYIGQHNGKNLHKYLQTKRSDARNYRGGRSRLYSSMRRHTDKETWSIYPLISDLQTREECDHWEKLLIKALKVQHPDIGYNICRGGEGFTREQMLGNQHGKGNKGRKNPKSPEACQNISKALTGVPKSPAHAKAIGEGRKGVKGHYTPESRARLAVMKGKKHKPETIEKMKISHTGVLHTEDSKQKMRKPKNHEAVENMKAAQQSRRAAITHCPYGHPLVEGNLVLCRLPHRLCLTCARARVRKSEKKRQERERQILKDAA